MVSLHGGHSGEFCEHASGSLRQVIEAAVSSEFRTLGISEHAPRPAPRFLYETERAKGYSVDRLEREFEAYAATSKALQRDFRNRLPLLRGFEAEVIPSGRYAETMLSIRARHGFDYMVGSVHYVAEISIDESRESYSAAVETCGGLERFFVRYYDLVREMIVVPDTLPVPELFEHFLDGREHIALVVDQYGGTSGIVTMEDVIETLLGPQTMESLEAAIGN